MMKVTRKQRRARQQETRRPGRLWLWGLLAAAAFVVYLTARERSALPLPGPASHYGYQVVNVYPHDPGAFTQGLIFRQGFLFESTGLNGQSSLRKVRLETGEVVQRLGIDPQHFAEGLTDVGDQTGRVTGRVDLGGLLPPADRMPPVDVLNGIAYDAERDRLFVTGKLWPRLFEIRLRR